ncbi:DUF3224 domain-containing protein [Cellulomonas sp. URHB0016]
MIADGTFQADGFGSVAVEADQVPTALLVGVATMVKQYAGAVEGRSTTLFTSAFDPEKGVGTYVAMESFEGALGGVGGTFNYVHAATTHGTDRVDLAFSIVPSSGTGGLEGITGTGSMSVDEDGTHRVSFEYELPGRTS